MHMIVSFSIMVVLLYLFIYFFMMVVYRVNLLWLHLLFLFLFLFASIVCSIQSSGYEVYILEASYKDPAVSLSSISKLLPFQFISGVGYFF